MRSFYFFILISFYSFSQTNENIINQIKETAKSENITTKAQALEALEASGMTENQARQLARQRGLSYDQLMDEYFNEKNNSVDSNSKDP